MKMPRSLAVSKYRFLSGETQLPILSDRASRHTADGRLLVRASAALLRLI
jgi:hypothetical protein